MSQAVHSQGMERGELHTSMHLHGEVAGGFPNRDQVKRRDQYFTLRHNYSVLAPAIDDAGEPAAQISSNNRVHYVGWQSGNARQRRFSVANSHVDFPRPQEAREHHTATVGHLTQNFRHSRQKSACVALQPQAECSILGNLISNPIQPVFSSPGRTAAVSQTPAPASRCVAAANNSRACASQAPGPSLATGMSRDPANAGGEHEEVAHSPCNFIEGNDGIETTSLTVVEANRIDEEHSGTAPGASGPERDIFGALNFAAANNFRRSA